MTVINNVFINECFKFLKETVNTAISEGIEETQGFLPNGPKYMIRTEMNKHTKIGKYSVALTLTETPYFSIYGGEYRLGDKKLLLSQLQETEFEQYTGVALYNVINTELDFSEKLDYILSGATHEVSIKHFTGIEVKYHREDDSHRFMICREKDIYYALEEAVLVQDGFSFTNLNQVDVLKAKAMSVIEDWMQSFAVPKFEHTFNQEV